MGARGADAPHDSGAATRRAAALAASALLLPVAIGYGFAAAIKALNPAAVDVTQGLAYLREILAVTWGVAAVWVVTVMIVLMRIGRASGRATVTPAWTVLAVQAVCLAVILGARLLTPG